MRTLYLCGAGNSEGVRLALTINRLTPRWDRLAILDDDPRKLGKDMLGVEILGGFDLLAQAQPETDEVANLVARTTAKRRGAKKKIESFNIPFASLISPDVDTLGVTYGRDVTAYQNAIMGPEVSIGEGTVMFMGAIAGHESVVGRGCVLAANSVLNARVHLEDGVYVGTNATVLPEITIGAGATIGAGSVVIQNVHAGETVMGVPAVTILGGPPAPIAHFKPAHNGGSTNGVDLIELERTISHTWREILGTKTLAPTANFFDSGGDSLGALRLCEALKRELQSDLSLMDIFQFPTVRLLTQALARRMAGPQGPTIELSRAAMRRTMTSRRRRTTSN